MRISLRKAHTHHLETMSLHSPNSVSGCRAAQERNEQSPAPFVGRIYPC